MQEEEPWLLRSPETDSYDLLTVGGSWGIWLGRIDNTEVNYACNACNEAADCNLNGQVSLPNATALGTPWFVLIFFLLHFL